MNAKNAIEIQPKNFGKTATKVVVEINGFGMGSTTGTAIAIYKDAQDNELERTRVAIPENIFTAWGTDDSVITNYVLQQVGVTKK